MLIERTYDLPYALNYPSIVEELADWLLAVLRVVESERSHVAFPFIAGLASLSLTKNYPGRSTPQTDRALVLELYDAFVILRTGGDSHEARAGFALALTHAAKALQ